MSLWVNEHQNEWLTIMLSHMDARRVAETGSLSSTLVPHHEYGQPTNNCCKKCRGRLKKVQADIVRQSTDFRFVSKEPFEFHRPRAPIMTVPTVGSPTSQRVAAEVFAVLVVLYYIQQQYMHDCVCPVAAIDRACLATPICIA